MTLIGAALRLKADLAALAERHCIPPPVPLNLELLPPTDDSPLIVSGLASTYTTDAERMRFAPQALTWNRPSLCYRPGSDQVGTIYQLSHSPTGLRVVALVHCPIAACSPAFSITATIFDYCIRHPDSPDYFALITSARVDEVSLTPSP